MPATINEIPPALFGVLLALALPLALAVLFKLFYVRPPLGAALIVSGPGAAARVHFGGAFVCPLVQRAQCLRRPRIALEIERRGRDGLLCRDNLRADISLTFYLEVKAVAADVLRAAAAAGPERAADPGRLGELFRARFSEALDSAGRQFDLDRIVGDRRGFRDRVAEIAGSDLHGYTLAGLAVERLEQTPGHCLDPANVFDAEGGRKIAEVVAWNKIAANAAARDQEAAVKRKDVETRMEILELERRLAAAEAAFAVGGAAGERDGASEPGGDAYEECRRRFEERLEAFLAGQSADPDAARRQAEAVSAVLAKIGVRFTGGDPAFYDFLTKALGLGQVAAGFTEKSPFAKTLLDAAVEKIKETNFDPALLARLAESLMPRDAGGD